VKRNSIKSVFGLSEKGKVYSSEKASCTMLPEREGSGSIVRSDSIILAKPPAPSPFLVS
jgi:hypothetical protein